MSSPDDVLDFWFGPLDAQGRVASERLARWWKKDPAFDREVRDRFGADYEAVANDHREPWLATSAGRLAYVVVLDQFSRNMYRDTPRMFAEDARALAVARDGVDAGADRALPTAQRSFLYMPFMHSEDLAMQERCVALFAALRDEPDSPADIAETYVHFAEQHRDIVARFGRFPHRNTLLGRASTPEEEAFLAGPGSSF